MTGLDLDQCSLGSGCTLDNVLLGTWNAVQGTKHGIKPKKWVQCNNAAQTCTFCRTASQAAPYQDLRCVPHLAIQMLCPPRPVILLETGVGSRAIVFALLSTKNQPSNQPTWNPPFWTENGLPGPLSQVPCSWTGGSREPKRQKARHWVSQLRSLKPNTS